MSNMDIVEMLGLCGDSISNEAAKTIVDLRKENQARREILDAVADNLGAGNCWMAAAEIDWKKRLRDYATDSEQHEIDADDWRSNRDVGITLYIEGNFLTAYFDDARELWERADDERPMFHVMAKGTPHRTCIHAIHLLPWVTHLAEVCMPVRIMHANHLERQ